MNGPTATPRTDQFAAQLDALEATHGPGAVDALADRLLTGIEQAFAPTMPVATALRPSRPENMPTEAPARITGPGGVKVASLPEALAAALASPLPPRGRQHVATVHADASMPELGSDPRRNEPVITEALRALTASGGVCTPVPHRHDVAMWATSLRPVRDGLPSFRCDRGGIRFNTPPKFGDAAAGVGVWTEANDASPGSDGPSTKAMLVLACAGEATEVMLDAITMSMRYGNFAARWNPEHLASYMTLLEAEHAALAEQNLLTEIDAGSKAVNAGEVLGTARDVLAVLDRAGASYRSRQRMRPTEPLTCVMPAWLRDMFRTDLARQMPGDDALAVSDAVINELFRVRSIVPVWSIDEARFGTQGVGPLIGWPGTVKLRLFAPGTWLFLNGGVLDFGVIRDAQLVAKNDAVVFMESFEQVAKVGVESLRITVNVCPNGGYASALDVNVCVSGS